MAEWAAKTFDFFVQTGLDVVSVLGSPYSGLYWLYLASALLIIAVVYFLRDAAPGRRDLMQTLRFCFPREVYLTRTFRLDLGMCIGNILLYSFFFGTLILSAVWVEEYTWRLLHELFGAPSVFWEGWTAKILLTLALILAVDLGFFLSHYLHHRFSLLWKFHKVHHSAEQLNPITAYRRHPVDLMIDGNITGLLTGITLGIFDYFSEGRLAMLTIAGVNAGIFVFLMTAAHLQHSHVWISYGRTLNRIFISPAMHQIHHSRALHHRDRNMGNIFSFWDALAGTRYLPETRESLEYGLVGVSEKPYRNVVQLYLRPFAEIIRPGIIRIESIYRRRISIDSEVTGGKVS